MTRKLLIDTDPGVDDALALLLALCSRDVEVIGVTTTYGNTDVKSATRNALYLLELTGRSEIPVASGAEVPLNGARRSFATHIHGENGLGNLLLPAPRGQPAHDTAAEFIARTVMEHPGEITLVTLGPLTNIARALELEPRISKNVAGVVVMGGAFRIRGNVSDIAEANIFNDPLAAARVLDQDWPLTLVGLDVTTRVVLTHAYLQRLQRANSLLGEFIWRVTRVYEHFHLRRYGMLGIYAHDPAALACALDPTLFLYEECRIEVTVDGPETGRTVPQSLPPTRPPHHSRSNIRICTDVDVQQVLIFIRQRLGSP
jgi:purine nucleosidase